MKINSFPSLCMCIALTFSILSFGSCKKDDDTNSSTDEYTYLSATIDGETYTGLKPLPYSLNGVATLIDETLGAKYLKLQGSGADYEVNILISENNWGNTGTFTLDPGIFPTENGYYGHVVAGIGNPTIDFFEGVTGSLTITKFDLATKKIEGTFNLEYYRRDSNTYVQSGPFYVTDGTLDFPLDNDEFQ